MRDRNCFITLTYNDQSVPVSNSVSKSAWQDFMKRLRARISPTEIKFFACGEYGDKNGRPHYHALIFGYDFPDKTLWTIRRKNPVYRSALLESLWSFGNSEIGRISYQSAAYVARYCMKKVVGDKSDDYYTRVSPIDGNIYTVEPEFALMSRRPGLGTLWFNEFASDAFPSDFIIVDGRKAKPPKFYLNKLKEDDPNSKLNEHSEKTTIKNARRRFAVKHKENSTPARLREREAIQLSKSKLLKREL